MAEAQLNLIITPAPKKHHKPRRSLTVSIPLDEIEEKDTPILSDSEEQEGEEEADDDTSQDPNIEIFLKQTGSVVFSSERF